MKKEIPRVPYFVFVVVVHNQSESLLCRSSCSSIILHCPSSRTISERGHAVRTKSV